MFLYIKLYVKADIYKPNKTHMYVHKYTLTYADVKQGMGKYTLFKDARSVSLYAYDRSQISQYVKYTKWINIEKGIEKFVTNNVLLNEK